jgi:hypothetical protein
MNADLRKEFRDDRNRPINRGDRLSPVQPKCGYCITHASGQVRRNVSGRGTMVVQLHAFQSNMTTQFSRNVWRQTKRKKPYFIVSITGLRSVSPTIMIPSEGRSGNTTVVGTLTFRLPSSLVRTAVTRERCNRKPLCTIAAARNLYGATLLHSAMITRACVAIRLGRFVTRLNSP